MVVMRPITELDTDSVLGNLLQISSVLVLIAGIVGGIMAAASSDFELSIIAIASIVLCFILFALGSIYNLTISNNKMNKEVYKYLSTHSNENIPLP